MAKRNKVIVMGLDTAAVNSGVCIIEAFALPKEPHVEANVIFEAGFVHSPLRDHTERAMFSDKVKGLCLLHAVQFVAMEDYAMRLGPNNTSAYQHGETVGMVKKSLWEINMPFMVTPPTSMRSFMTVPSKQKDSGKQFIMDFAKDTYGFESAMTNQNKRSNATDAFIHCVIGAMVYFDSLGENMGKLNKAKQEVLYGNGKKMEGLTKSPQYFFGCHWKTFEEAP